MTHHHQTLSNLCKTCHKKLKTLEDKSIPQVDKRGEGGGGGGGGGASYARRKVDAAVLLDAAADVSLYKSK